MATNWIARWLEGNHPPRLTSAQAEAFAQSNQRRPEALLAAYQASGERAFLKEAAEKYPNDPRVAFAAAALIGRNETNAVALDVRRQWLDTFQRTAPDNALADYLSAREHFKAGEADVALQEIYAAAEKPMRDYALDWIQNTEEAYRASGYSDAEAKAAATSTLLMPQLAEMRDVGKNLVDLAKSYRAVGDESSAQTALQLASHLGARLDTPGALTLLQSMVGVAIQRNVLTAGDANSASVVDPSVPAQLAALEQRREAVRSMARESAQVLPTLSDQDLVVYFDRLKLFGDEEAIRWLLRGQEKNAR